MFTGIVKGAYKLKQVTESESLKHFEISFPTDLLPGLEIGASVSVDGVCLTVAKIIDTHVFFDLVASTLQKSNLGNKKSGDLVNLERSYKVGDENGGHEVSGHVDFTAELVKLAKHGESANLAFKTNQIKYFFPQGFVAVNGVSLTISAVDREQGVFEVWLIPETLKRTNLGQLSVGSLVNVEVHKPTQILVDTIYLAAKSAIQELLITGEVKSTDLDKLATKAFSKIN